MPNVVGQFCSSKQGIIPPAVAGGSIQALVQLFGAPVVLLSTLRENSLYTGRGFQLVRSDGSSPIDLPYSSVGKGLNSAIADAYLGGGTAFVAGWYDESGGANNALQATNARRPQFIRDVDGQYSVVFQADGKGLEIADSASYKASKLHCFLVMCGDNSVGGSQTEFIIGYTAAGTGIDVARWGLGWIYGNLGGPNGHDEAMLFVTRNAANANVPSGQAYRRSSTNDFVVWDFKPQTLEFRIDDGRVINDPVTNANITYPTSEVLMIGNNRAYTNSFRGRLRAVMIFDAERADENAISAYLNSQAAFGLPGIPWTFPLGGLTWTPAFYGSYDLTVPDALGYQWKRQIGAYDWSYAEATVSNGTLRRFGVHQFDTDTIVDGRERAEITSPDSFVVNQGDTFTRFFGIMIEPGDGPTAGATGAWCDIGQNHYGDTTATPDLWLVDMRNDVAVVVSQRAPDLDTTVSLGLLTRGVKYALLVEIFWSPSGTLDTRKVWFGVYGGVMTQVENLGPTTIFDQIEIAMYVKNGVYRGDDGQTAKPYFVQIANDQYVKNSPGAYSAYVAAQPKWPTA